MSMRVIDLKSPEGNAFVLLSVAAHIARNTGKDPAPILERMKEGNYNNLVTVFEQEFKGLVKLKNKHKGV